MVRRFTAEIKSYNYGVGLQFCTKVAVIYFRSLHKGDLYEVIVTANFHRPFVHLRCFVQMPF